MSEEKNMMAEANEETAQTTQSERVIDLGKPYKFEGTEYTSIDLSGLDKLTVKDAIDAQRQLFNLVSLLTFRPYQVSSEMPASISTPLTL